MRKVEHGEGSSRKETNKEIEYVKRRERHEEEGRKNGEKWRVKKMRKEKRKSCLKRKKKGNKGSTKDRQKKR